MFAPKKMIPKMVVGMLALTGCSGTDGMPGGSGGNGGNGGTAGSGGTAGNDLANAVSAFCMKLEDECGSGGGASEECTEYFVDNYSGYSAECHAALISYFECFGEQEGCDDFSACDDYDDAANDAC
jgi:hypothetical protein